MFKGGKDHNIGDVIQVYEEDGWTTVANMKVPRYHHAVSVVNFNYFCLSFL